jgi:hypothetical protein
VEQGFSVKVNGEWAGADLLQNPTLADSGGGRRSTASGRTTTASPGWFVELKRVWSTGDKVEVTLPKTLRLEPVADNPRRAAILWGPLVLAGDLGPGRDQAAERSRQPAWQPHHVPVLVAADRPVKEWLREIPDEPGCFRTDGVGRDEDVILRPFYRVHRRTYAVYWDLFTPDEWRSRAAEITAEHEQRRQLERATVAFVQPGEMQPERDHNLQGEDTSPVRIMGRPGRRAARWFSFDLAVDSSQPMRLVVSYVKDEWRRRTFDILVDGERIAEQVVEERGPTEFFDVQYAIPAALVQGKGKVTVRFQGTEGSETAAVFGLRVIRAE